MSIKDNTYMLFSPTCGTSKPASFQQPENKQQIRVKKFYMKTGFTKLNEIKVNLDKLSSEYEIIYNHLKEKYYKGDDYSWRWIVLCLHTMINMIKDIIQNYAITIIKTVSTPLIDVLLFPLFSIIFLIIGVIKAYINGESLRDHFYNITIQIKKIVSENLYNVLGILVKYSQSIAFLFMCKNLSSGEKTTKAKNKVPSLMELANSLSKATTDTTKYVLSAGRYFGNVAKDVHLFSSTVFWGIVSYASQKAIDTLRYFFNGVKNKMNIKKGDSFIFDKFENTINNIEISINEKYKEESEKLQNIAVKVKTQFKIAKIVLNMPSVLLTFSQFITYYGYNVYFDKLYILSWIYESFKAFTELEVYNFSVPTLVFLTSIILRFVGTCWNYVQYKACLVSKCDIIDYTVYMDLERKTCMDQCWNQGVDGISSLLVPTIVIDELKRKYADTQIFEYILPLININNSIQKGGLSILLLNQAGISPIIVKFNEMTTLLTGEKFYSGLL